MVGRWAPNARQRLETAALDLFVENGYEETTVAQIADRGINPAEQETYSNGVRKTTYVDPEGNEIGFGQVPG